MPSFNPPIRVLMGPGPSDIHPRVLAAMARPCIGHLDPVFQSLMEDMKELLRYAFRTKNRLTMPASGPSAAITMGALRVGGSARRWYSSRAGSSSRSPVLPLAARPATVEEPATTTRKAKAAAAAEE